MNKLKQFIISLLILTGLALPAQGQINLIDFSNINSVLSADANGTRNIGTTAKGWGNVFLATTKKIDWGNGNATITHSSNALTLAAGTITLNDITDVAGVSVTISPPLTVFDNSIININHAYTPAGNFPSDVNLFQFSTTLNPSANQTGSTPAFNADFLVTVTLEGDKNIAHAASGQFAQIINNNSGTVTGFLGSTFDSYIINNAGGVIPDAYTGTYSYFQNISGTTTNWYGNYVVADNSGTLTNSYLYYAYFPGDISGTWTNNYVLYAESQDGPTNSYYLWFDSQGVYRIREDNVVDPGNPQAVTALYNPRFTKYTAGAANHERIIFGQWNTNVAEIGTEAGGTGTLRALRFLGSSFTFTNNVNPNANDGAALGTTALGWSDAYFASGGVLDWANGGFQAIHAANELTFYNPTATTGKTKLVVRQGAADSDATRLLEFRTPAGAAFGGFGSTATSNLTLRFGTGDGTTDFTFWSDGTLSINDNTGAIYFGSRGNVSYSADGKVLWVNNAGSDFGMHQFGGTTSSFPALKRSSATLQARLADDSAGAIFVAQRHDTTSNCADSAGAAACGSASAGAVVIDASATTVVVSTTAVTANSRILIAEDSSLGTELGITCNTTISNDAVTARTAATSFTITTAVAPVTTPRCFSFFLVN